jgi:hypothetical protein
VITVPSLGLRGQQELADDEAARLIAAGGDVRPGELSMTGDLAEIAFERLRFDTFVLGCCGIDARDGITTHLPADATSSEPRCVDGRCADRSGLVMGNEHGKTSTCLPSRHSVPARQRHGGSPLSRSCPDTASHTSALATESAYKRQTSVTVGLVRFGPTPLRS